MFTGIVEATGMVRAVESGCDVARLGIEPHGDIGGAKVGDSIAVSGVCLTVARLAGKQFEADLTTETLARTTLGALRPGDTVNLERPVAVGGRLGGHMVQGHVDGVGRVLRHTVQGESSWLETEAPPSVARYIVEKGSIAVDGVSLTVAAIDGVRFTVCLIPHTCAVTTLGALAPGARVNLEVDILAKYVERLLVAYAPAGAAESDASRSAGDATAASPCLIMRRGEPE